MEEDNIKLSVHGICPLKDWNRICEAIVNCGFKGFMVDNGNVIFERVTNSTDKTTKTNKQR